MIEIEEALNTSQKGARLAAQTPSWQRREWLNSVANEIQSAKQQLAELIVAEGVKTIREADVEVSRAAATFALSAEEVGRHAGKVIALDRMRGRNWAARSLSASPHRRRARHHAVQRPP